MVKPNPQKEDTLIRVLKTTAKQIKTFKTAKRENYDEIIIRFMKTLKKEGLLRNEN